MNNLQLGAAILLVIVAVPLIVGYCWPSDSEIENTWETENELDVTPSIATQDIPIIDAYSGPNNNLWLYPLRGNPSYDPVSYTESPSNIPKSNVVTTGEVLSTGKTFNPADFTGYRYDIYSGSGWIYIEENGVPTDYQFSSIAYYPDSASIWGLETSKMVHVTVTPDTRVIYGGTPSNPTQIIYKEYTPTGEYVDFGKGFQLDTQQDLYWSNGLVNYAASVWIKTDAPGSITLGTWGTGQNDPSVTVTTAANYIMVGNRILGSPTAYPYVEIEISHQDGITVKGIMGADSFTDGTYTVGNTVAVSGSVPIFETLRMNGDIIYEIKRTTSEIGTGKGILDATITPYSYYPHYSWQISLTQPATFGDSIRILGTTYPVTNGTITLPDVEEPIPIRDMAILSLQLDGVQHIYVNGNEVWSGAPDPTASIGLNGAWYVDVSVYDVEQGVKDHYLWSVGGFGLDQTGYCMVGIMTSLTMALAGGMYGKRSMGKAAIVMLISGMSAAAYYCFL